MVLSAKRSAEVRYSREVGDKAEEPEKGAEAERLVAALKELQRAGKKGQPDRDQRSEARSIPRSRTTIFRMRTTGET